MIKKVFTATLFIIFFLSNAVAVSATHGPIHQQCEIANPKCQKGEFCKPFEPPLPTSLGTCEKSSVWESFGSIEPPLPLQQFIGKDPTGAGGISRFLSNLVALFYGLAGIVLIFMLLWGAWDWMTSEGDKEKLDSAKKKIINAIVGIILFSIAFALIQILGQFTGFKFFVGQK